jgi:hypothetical protein
MHMNHLSALYHQFTTVDTRDALEGTVRLHRGDQHRHEWMANDAMRTVACYAVEFDARAPHTSAWCSNQPHC